MIFSIEQKDILDALNLVSTVVEKKSAIVILSNIHIKAKEDGIIELQGSNLLCHIKASVQGLVEEEGEMTVSAVKFLSLIKEASDLIKVDYSDEKETGGIAKLSFGNVKTELAVTNPKDFPVMRDVNGDSFLVHGGLFSSKLGKASNFVSNDETRKMLTGVSLKTEDGKLKVAGTNSHQMFSTVISGDFSQGMDIIVPDKAAKLIQNMCSTVDEDVSFVTDGECIIVKSGSYELFSRLLDSKYPDYEAIIPSYEGFALVDKASLKRNIRLVSVIMDDFDRALTLDFSMGVLSIKSKNLNSEKVKDTMEVEYNGNPYSISVNADYLTNIINSTNGKEVKIYFDVDDNGQRPIVVKSDDKENKGDLCLVMPVRS